MNTLTLFDRKWNPFKEMDELQNRLNHFFGTPTPTRANDEESMAPARWAPLVDIVEDEKEYLIKAELPEIKKDDISVKVEKGILSITGERKFEKEENEKRIFELASGGFSSTVRLAKSSADMWIPIFRQNRDNVLDVLDEHINQLARFRSLLIKQDFKKFYELIQESNKIKKILS